MSVAKDNLTVLVQGPYDVSITPKTISSIRRLFGGVPIVLSTWEGAEIPALPDMPDAVVYNKCPPPDAFGNFNRQRYSTLEGLKRVSTEYVFKIRSDFVLKNSNILALAKADAPRKFPVFEQRMLAYVWRPQPLKRNPRLFHPGDFYYLGLKRDLQRLFSVPESDAVSTGGFASSEHYLWVNFINKNSDKKVDIADLTKKDKTSYYNNVLCDNFIFANYYDAGVASLKSALKKNNIPVSNSAFSFCDWLKMSGCKNAPADFPNTKVPLGLRVGAQAVAALARVVQLFIFDKKRRESVRSKIYDLLPEE